MDPLKNRSYDDIIQNECNLYRIPIDNVDPDTIEYLNVVIATMVEAIARTNVTIADACRLAGISTNTYHLWKHKYPELEIPERLKKAKTRYRAQLLKKASDMAFNGDTKMLQSMLKVADKRFSDDNAQRANEPPIGYHIQGPRIVHGIEDGSQKAQIPNDPASQKPPEKPGGNASQEPPASSSGPTADNPPPASGASE
jgi:transposase-like protein